MNMLLTYPVVISDASVLIALAKMRRLEILRQTYSTVLIGPIVKNEVVDAGKRIAASGSEIVEDAIKQEWIQVVQPTAKERRLTKKLGNNAHLDLGEAEAIALASYRKHLLLVDDKEGRAVATMLDVVHIGTAGVLLETYFKGMMDFAQLENDLQTLTEVIWLSPEVVLAILKKARETKQ